jgi:hypothetical protein
MGSVPGKEVLFEEHWSSRGIITSIWNVRKGRYINEGYGLSLGSVENVCK